MALMKMGQGAYADYVALTNKDQYSVYYCTDTHQIFVGAQEYTKSTKTLGGVPTVSTEGDAGRLYAYNGGLYLCSGLADEEYQWTLVAQTNATAGTVSSVGATDGLETDQDAGAAITASGNIKHSVPTGAAVTADTIVDQAPGFGSTFAIQGIATDKFGHVTGINSHAVTIPTETPVTVTDDPATAASLAPGSTFTVLTGIGMSTAAGATDHDLEVQSVTFTAPADTTYSLSSVSEGVLTLTDSNAQSSTVAINGWDLLAKKADLTTVFKYKGTVATPEALPQTAGVQVGDVYQVTRGPQGTSCEYVCVDNTTPGSFTWEELGTTVDLSAYATTAYVDDKMSWFTF